MTLSAAFVRLSRPADSDSAMSLAVTLAADTFRVLLVEDRCESLRQGIARVRDTLITPSGPIKRFEDRLEILELVRSSGR